jgi:hypothetical protein
MKGSVVFLLRSPVSLSICPWLTLQSVVLIAVMVTNVVAVDTAASAGMMGMMGMTGTRGRQAQRGLPDLLAG